MLVPLERVEALEARVEEMSRIYDGRRVALRAQLVRLEEAQTAAIDAHTRAKDAEADAAAAHEAIRASIAEMVRLMDEHEAEDQARGQPGP